MRMPRPMMLSFENNTLYFTNSGYDRKQTPMIPISEYMWDFYKGCKLLGRDFWTEYKSFRAEFLELSPWFLQAGDKAALEAALKGRGLQVMPRKE